MLNEIIVPFIINESKDDSDYNKNRSDELKMGEVNSDNEQSIYVPPDYLRFRPLPIWVE